MVQLVKALAAKPEDQRQPSYQRQAEGLDPGTWNQALEEEELAATQESMRANQWTLNPPQSMDKEER